MDFIYNYWEAFIAILALIVSLISTTIAYFTFRLQRIHNIKSVVPMVHVGQWDYENLLNVTLVNLGAGLAIIKKIEVINKSESSRNSIYDWLPKKLSNGMNYKEYWTAYKNFVIQPGQVIDLIKIPVDVTIAEQIRQREDLRSILRQLTVVVKYDDLYNNEFPNKKMELYLFSRTDNENG